MKQMDEMERSIQLRSEERAIGRLRWHYALGRCFTAGKRCFMVQSTIRSPL